MAHSLSPRRSSIVGAGRARRGRSCRGDGACATLADARRALRRIQTSTNSLPVKIEVKREGVDFRRVVAEAVRGSSIERAVRSV